MKRALTLALACLLALLCLACTAQPAQEGNALFYYLAPYGELEQLEPLIQTESRQLPPNASLEKQIQTYLEDSTSKKFQSDVVNTLFYKIVIMNMNGAFGNMKYENRKVIENYFNMEIDMATRLYKSMISVIG